MSLASCPECKGQVSSEALLCPHCGHPLIERIQVSLTVTVADPVEDEVREVLLREGRQAAVDRLKSLLPALGVADARSRVARIEAALPPGKRVPESAKGCGNLFAAVVVLLLVWLLIALFW